jgi:hypothetical protein
MRFNGNILGVDNRASAGNTRGLWTLPPQAQARRRGAWSVFDQDAAAYIAAVEAQDQQPLELEIKDAIHTFVAGCKTDGIWADIKACAILCGARTLDGALIALVGTNPTNNNFVGGDYSRAVGLTSTATQFLDSNRNNNADPQDDQHMAFFVTTALVGGAGAGFIGAGLAVSGATSMANNVIRNRNSATEAGTGLGIGFRGMSRDNGANFQYGQSGAAEITYTRASQTPLNQTITVFRRNAGSADGNSTLAFYSIGEALDLTLLEKNVTRLIGAIQGRLL